jgi:hypothetical protein
MPVAEPCFVNDTFGAAFVRVTLVVDTGAAGGVAVALGGVTCGAAGLAGRFV